MRTFTAILLLLTVIGAGTAAASMDSIHSMLQKGIYAEETEGNLEKAIELYEKVLEMDDEYVRYAARATYQLGACYLKKGEKEKAAEYFKDVTVSFPGQTRLVKKAREKLEKMGLSKVKQGNIFEILGGQVSAYIGSKYGEVCAEAGAKKLYSSSRIYVVDSSFYLHEGGMGYVYNWTGQPITDRYKISNTSYPNQKLYSMYGDEMDIEIVPYENRNNFYQIYWNPEKALQPGEFFNYGWAIDGSTPLSQAGGTYSLTMQNHLSQYAYETFFLAVPQGTVLSDQSKEYTGKGTVNNWDIYWWKKIVQQDENHVVVVQLQKKQDEVIELSHDNGQPAGKWSFAGGGHAVRFAAPTTNSRLHAVKIYGSRYGEYEVPDEDFTVWVCDKNFQVLEEFHFPYSHFSKRGFAGWVTLETGGIPVPEEFAVCVSFDPHRTKGIYVYHDGDGTGDSYRGLPGSKMDLFLDGDWLIRAVIQTESRHISKENKLQAENFTSEGWKLWGQRKLTEAEETFKKAVDLDPAMENAWQGLGWAQLNQGKQLNAQNSFERCIELNPNNSAALNGLGWIAYGQGNAEKAIEWWEKAVTVSDGQATASLNGLTKV